MAGDALAGIKVVEMATMVAGPYCGKMLADLGADVIKVELPGGDPARGAGPFPASGEHPERSALFLYLNTSKRGITLDPDAPSGLDALKRLVGWADLFIDGFSPERMQGFGLSPEALAHLKPALVHTSITPYGRTGPRAGTRGDELTLINAGGLANLLPPRAVDVDRAPVKMAGYSVGYHGGITAALASLAALLSQKKTGRGQFIDISLQEAILAMVRCQASGTRYQDSTWSRVPDRPPAMGRMKTRDGYIVVGTPENHHFRAFRELMGNPPWVAGKEWETLAYRSHHLMEVTDRIDEWALQQSKNDLHHRGARMGIAMGPMDSAEDVMKNEQYAARGYFVEVEHPEAGTHRYAGWPYRMTATPARVGRPAPLLGEHNREVYCNELGYSAEEYERLRNEGAVGSAEGKDGR